MDRFLIILAIAALPIASVTALVDAIRRPSYIYKAARRSKSMTVAGLLLTCGVGAIFYWVYLRRLIVRAEGTASPPRERPRVDPWADDDGSGW